MDPGWVIAAVSLGTALVGLATVAARIGWRLAVRVTRLLDDYFGEPAHDGLPAHLGVMARLAQLERSVQAVSAEVHVNDGGSLKDMIVSTAADMAEVRRDMKNLDTRVRRMNGGA